MRSPALHFRGDLIGLMAETCQGFIQTCECQCLLQGLKRNGESVWTKLSFLSQTFWFLCPFHSFLGIRTTNLICWIIGFQGTCDLGCYCALLLWPQAWIGSQEAPSLARKLDGALAPRASLRLKVTQIGNAMCFFLW